jgi:hypothetical protein
VNSGGYRWVREEGNNLIFIYGSDDPWSGGAVELTGQTNALFFMHPGGDHRICALLLKNNSPQRLQRSQRIIFHDSINITRSSFAVNEAIC